MKFVKKIIYIAALILFIILLMPSMVFATRNSIEVTGRIYEFDEKSEYKYSESDTYLLTDLLIHMVILHSMVMLSRVQIRTVLLNTKSKKAI